MLEKKQLKSIPDLERQLIELGSPEAALKSKRFFKCGKGEYSECDVFLGISVPDLRRLASASKDTPLKKTLKLLRSRYHEARMLALFLMIERYKVSSIQEKEVIFNHYLKLSQFINNWDLVDCSASQIVGDFLLTKSKNLLFELIKSESLWQRRIAIVATLRFIRNNEFQHTLKLCQAVLKDKEDLIHKASGWMLREVGKKDIAQLKKFLDRHHKEMPRTMLRYSIERLSREEKREYTTR